MLLPSAFGSHLPPGGRHGFAEIQIHRQTPIYRHSLPDDISLNIKQRQLLEVDQILAGLGVALGENGHLTADDTAGAANQLLQRTQGFTFHPQNFVENLKYMGLGMLAIFIVIGVIVGITYLLNALFQEKSK